MNFQLLMPFVFHYHLMKIHSSWSVFDSHTISLQNKLRGGGLANHIEESKLLKEARVVAEIILRNNQDLVLRSKSVINDGLEQVSVCYALSYSSRFCCS
ncbi:hypothetical protein RHMOL_Rhmol12G0189500 [Rhododendron molle]|uniref:Uncharacterized protein n=1 Tax=Rhododendron molle TaxID=49168 RepID=A0ACC0LK63_RHOML|nr:hypothetical protein RHMOL_Rhmol12G0189500 [Rhododendron molle]